MCLACADRTGKSYILNQLAGTDRGFGVGSSVQAKTKGIWLWGAPIKVDSPAPGAPQHVLLLDTEGLQSIEATEGHDAKIFSLAILLSSFFVYNSEKAINNAAIDQLSLVAQLTQRIRVNAAADGGDAGGESLAGFFPNFTWLLRDFQLELTSADGHEMSSDEYLEECLRPQPGKSAAVKEQNETRQAIRQLFTERSCIALPHPTLGTPLPPTAVKDLPPLAQLAEPFQHGVRALKRRIFECARAKTMGTNGPALNGPMLLQLAESYVEAINGGALPTISTAWQAAISLECHRALDEARAQYAAGVGAATQRAEMLDEATWRAEHSRLQAEALLHFKSQALGDGSKAFEEQLLAIISAERVRAEEALLAKSHALCERVAFAQAEALTAYMRRAAQTAGFRHADALPALLGEVLAAYESGASGGAKSAGLAALLAKALPVVGEVLGAVEAAEEGARKAAAASSAESADLRAQVQDVKAQLGNATRDLDTSRRELRDEKASASARLGAQKAELEARVKSERDESSRLTAQLHAETTRQAAEGAARSAELAASRARVDELSTQLDRLRTSCAELQAAAKTHGSEASKKDKEIAALQLQLERLQGKLAEAQAAHELALERSQRQDAARGDETGRIRTDLGRALAERDRALAGESEARAAAAAEWASKVAAAEAQAKAAEEKAKAAEAQAKTAEAQAKVAEAQVKAAEAQAKAAEAQAARAEEAARLAPVVAPPAPPSALPPSAPPVVLTAAPPALAAPAIGAALERGTKRAAPAEAAEAPRPAKEPKRMTVAELRGELSALGLETTGVKAVLIERLEEARLEPSRPPTAMSAATVDLPPSSPVSEEPPPSSFQPLADVPDVGSSAVVEESEINFEPRDKPPEKRRSSVGAHELAMPVLQARLRAALGAKYKLPKKKPDLLALYIAHCEAA